MTGRAPDRALATVSLLCQARLEEMEREVAMLDAAVAAAHEQAGRAERLVRVQEDALVRLDASNRAQLVGRPIAANKLSARLSTVRQITDQLGKARVRLEEANAALAAVRASRQEVQPRIRAAHTDLERWRTLTRQTASLRRRERLAAEELAAEDEAQDRAAALRCSAD